MSLLAQEAPSWGAVRKGRRDKPDRIFLYATEKFGKTSFALGAPKPVFLDFEDGSAEFDNLESFDMRGASAERILETLDMIRSAPNGYQTLVIDTADAMERSIQANVIREAGVTSIEEVDGGYGKGYTRCAEAVASIFRKLDEIRDAGLNVIVLAHAGTATFDNPAGANYSRFEPKLEKKSRPIPKEWADAILFGMFEDIIVNADKKNLRGKATGGRRRILHTVRAAAWDAGNRYGLPARLVLTDDPSESWAVYAKARAAGRASSEAMLLEASTLLLKVESADERAAIQKWIEERKDNPNAVKAGLNRLREKVESDAKAKEGTTTKKKEEEKS